MITADILGERARLSPDRTALVWAPTGERYTYRELDERARRLASHWVGELGISHGVRVGVLAGNCVEYVIALFAAAKSGVVLVPLNTRLAPPELAAITEDAMLSGLVYDADHAALAETIDAEHRMRIEERPGLCEDAVFERVDPEDTLCMLYTSGTTGRPKGVMIPHRMAAWNAYNTAVCWGLREDDVAPVFTPMYHAGGLAVFLTPLFLMGGTIILHPRFDADAIWRSIERDGVTVVFGVPTTYQMMMNAPAFATADLSRLRWLISGGAPLPAFVIDAYQRRGLTFKQGYGMTEVGVNCFAMTDEDSRRKMGSIGKPMLFTEAKLVNDELWLRGPHVCNGYWRNREATKAAIDADDWFHTGDVARMDDEGFYYISGRAKDMFISGGVNVYPAEVEQALLQHPSIEDAAVIGVPDPRWGECGAAFVVLRADAQACGNDLVHFLLERVAKYKIPARFFFVGSLPRSAYGKVLKLELQKMVQELTAGETK